MVQVLVTPAMAQALAAGNGDAGDGEVRRPQVLADSKLSLLNSCSTLGCLRIPASIESFNKVSCLSVCLTSSYLLPFRLTFGVGNSN